ncbi:MAG TPA: hypothetical protein VG839_10005 [Asticcacaulis sp.]|nr:hypothetical protein [Asticcacaulis sp.]
MTDKDLLDLLELSESEAAKILGKSRQSLYQAGLAGRSDYFRKSDIKSLVFEARARAPKLDLSPVADYVAETRDSRLANEIRVDGQLINTKTLLNCRELLIVIPEIGWMTKYHPDSMDMLLSLGQQVAHVTYYTSSEPDKIALQGALAVKNVNQTVECATWIGAIPPLIIGNPTGSADIYVFASGHFAPNDWYGGGKLAVLIKALANGSLMPAVL